MTQASALATTYCDVLARGSASSPLACLPKCVAAALARRHSANLPSRIWNVRSARAANLERVCHDHNRLVALSIHALQHLHDLGRRVAIKAAGRLVRPQDRRLMNQRASDGDPLSLSTGEFRWQAPQLVCESHIRKRTVARACAPPRDRNSR